MESTILNQQYQHTMTGGSRNFTVMAPPSKLSISDFNSELTSLGKELLDKLIRLIRSDPSFVIDVRKPTYINIEIKKPIRIALQIHRVADNNDSSQLGLAIAGWSKDDPKIENKYAIVRRDIKMLSGLHDTTTENYWLRGKINSNVIIYSTTL